MGETYRAQQKEVDKVLHARNHSILAHGILPVGPEPFNKFAAIIMDICNIDEDELPVFPGMAV